jgi:pilus assembly protein CpaB
MNFTHTKAKWWLMAVSIVLGCISAWIIDQYINDKTGEIESRTRLDQLTLLVAAKDLDRDATIEMSDFVAEMFPVKWAPDDAITIEQADILVGKRLLSAVRAGQPLLRIHLQELEAPGVSTLLGPDLKAVSLNVDPSSAASGLIRGGDRVDLFVSLDHQGQRITTGLLQSVRVLGVGFLSSAHLRTDASSISETNITLAVSHSDAVKLVAAREAGTISAVLSSMQNATQDAAGRGEPRISPNDLAALLGLPIKPVTRVIPVMYGDRLATDFINDAQADDSAQELKDRTSNFLQRTVGAQ